MTNEQLQNLEFLPGEIKYLDRQLSEIDRQREHPPRFAAGHYEEFFAALQELHDALKERRDNCENELKALHAFIDDIPDHYLQDIFRMRYERGRSWIDISLRTSFSGGPYYSEANAKQSVFRYLRRVNEKDE